MKDKNKRLLNYYNMHDNAERLRPFNKKLILDQIS